LFFCSAIACAQFSGGNGTDINPYFINTPAELAMLATLVNAGNEEFNSCHYKLGNNLDLSEYQLGQGWTIIGNNDGNKAFKGKFDGNNKKIIGLKINTTSQYYAGLFGHVNKGEIINLGIENADIIGTCAGIVAGFLSNSIVSNCYSTGTVSANSVSYNAYAGGLAGFISENCTFLNCYSMGTASATSTYSYAISGGLVGHIEYNSNLSNCYSMETVSATSTYSYAVSGGIAGRFIFNSNLSNCYSTGNVNANSFNDVSLAGGLVGELMYSTISNCVAINPIVFCTSEYYGRVVGYKIGTTVSNIGFADMLNPAGNTTWNNTGVSNKDGETITCEEILSDGTFGGRFTSEGEWTTQNGRLPGLFGYAVDFPEHLCSSGYPPVITTTTLADGIVGVEYNHTLDIWGNLPIICSIETGNLPDGLHLFDNGEISEIPTMKGTFHFIVKAMNDFGFDTKELSITVITCETVNDLAAEKCGNNCVLLMWSEPESSLPVIEYQIYRNDEFLTSITTTSFLDENLEVGNYEYYVVVHYEMGCVSDSSNHVREKVELEVKEVKKLEEVRVWPNPAFTTVTIEANNFSKVEIYNVFGQLLNISMEKIVDISTLNSGVYFLKIYTEKGMVVKKVIKN